MARAFSHTWPVTLLTLHALSHFTALFLLILPQPAKLFLLGIAWEAESLISVHFGIPRDEQNFELVSLSSKYKLPRPTQGRLAYLLLHNKATEIQWLKIITTMHCISVLWVDWAPLDGSSAPCGV